MHFRRTAYEGEVLTKFQTKHVGRGIHKTQRAIKIERIASKFGLKTLRKHDLKNITGANVLLCFRHDRLELIATHVAAWSAWQQMMGGGNYRERNRLSELLGNPLNFSGRLFVRLAQSDSWIEERVRHNLQSAKTMVEDKKRTRNHEDHFGKIDIVMRGQGKIRLEKAHKDVGDKADRPSAETRQVRPGRKTIFRHQPPQFGKW